GKVIEELDSVVLETPPTEGLKYFKGYAADKHTLNKIRQELNILMDFDLLYASNIIEKENALDHLKALLAKLRIFPPTGNPDHFELQNMIQTAGLIVEQAIEFSTTFEKNQIQNNNFRRKKHLELTLIP